MAVFINKVITNKSILVVIVHVVVVVVVVTVVVVIIVVVFVVAIAISKKHACGRTTPLKHRACSRATDDQAVPSQPTNEKSKQIDETSARSVQPRTVVAIPRSSLTALL